MASKCSHLMLIDPIASDQHYLLKGKSAKYKIRARIRVVIFISICSIFSLSLFFPYSVGLPVFCLGFINYIYLLIFRIQNNTSVIPNGNANITNQLDRLKPSFSILIPLKNEAEVIRGTLDSIKGLNYPEDLKQIIIVVENTDKVTLKTLSRLELEDNMQILLIPEAAPYTKGRALLHGIKAAKGDILTVYDAESRPEADQLLKAASILASEGPGICLQAKIHISNKSTNWITRNFAGEYYEWYERHLKTLSHEGFSFGLGGNSFFIRRKELINAGSWDPFNVTEDADLAVRLIENGVRIRLLDSITKESCPENWSDWSNQRTRWNKGLFITQLVHLPGSILNGKFSFSQWVNFWLPMIGSALVPFYNLFIPAFMLCAGLSYYSLITMSSSLWVLLGINLIISSILNHITYQRIGIGRSMLSTLRDVVAYLMIHLLAGFKAYYEYFKSPLHWHKTQHNEIAKPVSDEDLFQNKPEIQQSFKVTL
jgi:cellulose synthase/poly-beta-1,6-N-acetylglucosamine synthase-like glycosyltransferase